MMTLYDYVLSGSCYKVRLFASLIGIEYKASPVDFYPGKEHKSAAFLEINPLGQLPVLVDGDLTLRDAQAILVYLATQYDKDRCWYPDTPEAMASIAMWLAFAGGELMASSGARLHDMLAYPLDIETLREQAHDAFRVLDDHLIRNEFTGGQWIATEQPSIADIACFPYVALSGDGGIELDDYAAIRRWLARVKALPGFIDMPGIV
jgi:glutathione S-transferase